MLLMIDPQKKLEQWRNEQPLLTRSMFTLLLAQQDLLVETEWTIDSPLPAFWNYLLTPLLDGLYANNAEISFCSYMWAFSETIERLLDEKPDFNILHLLLPLIRTRGPVADPIFSEIYQCSNLVKEDVAVLPRRHIMQTAKASIHQAYSDQIYTFLRCVSLQLLLIVYAQKQSSATKNTQKMFQMASDSMVIMEWIEQLNSRLKMHEVFSGNVMMPWMEEMVCLDVLTARSETEVMTVGEKSFFSLLQIIIKNDTSWIGSLANLTLPLLHPCISVSPQKIGLAEALQDLLLKDPPQSLIQVVTYQAWIFTDIFRTLHASNPRRADVLLGLTHAKILELCPDQQNKFLEALIPIYISNHNTSLVKISQDDIASWLEHFDFHENSTVIRDGVYILTKSLQLYYKKGDAQQELLFDLKDKPTRKILSYFPKEEDVKGHANKYFVNAISEILPSHACKISFKRVNSLIEDFFLDNDACIPIDLARLLAPISTLENDFMMGLQLTLATVKAGDLRKKHKRALVSDWQSQVVDAHAPHTKGYLAHQLSTTLITGFWDFLIYAPRFSTVLVKNFLLIFGDFTDLISHSTTYLQHASATIDRFYRLTFSEFPDEPYCKKLSNLFLLRLIEECLTKPHLEQNRRTGFLQRVLKNMAEVDEEQVLNLIKYLFLSVYFKDYLQALPAMRLAEFADLQAIDAKKLRKRIERVILKSPKGKFPPISVISKDPAFTYSQAMGLLILLVFVFRRYKSFEIFPNQEEWQNWILNLFTQLHQQDRETLLGKCLAELVIVSDVQIFIPKHNHEKFQDCLQIKDIGDQNKSIDDILKELALLDVPVRQEKVIVTPPPKKHDGRVFPESASVAEPVPKIPSTASQSRALLSRQKKVSIPKSTPKQSAVKIEVQIEEILTPDKLEKSLQRSLRAILRFIQNNPPNAISLSPTFLKIILQTQQLLICGQEGFQWDLQTGEQESESTPVDSAKSYAIQWNRLLSQCSIDLLKYSEREDKEDIVAKKAWCTDTLHLFNASYFRDPSLYLSDEINTWLQSIAGSKAMDGWISYLTGGVCLDESFLDIDLMFVRHANYIYTEQIDKEVWPQITSQFSQIQSEKIFDDANCVQYRLKIRLQDGSDLKMDVTIYTKVTSEAQVIENTSSSLVSTAAVRWRLDGRMLMLPTTALALYAKKPVVKMLGSPESLMEEIQMKRNKLGYLCKQIFKYENYRLDPMLNQVLLKATDLLLSPDHRDQIRPRFEEAFAYLLDEKRFTRPQASMRFILTRYNLLAMLYTSSNLDAAFHNACVTGFNLYFGVLLEGEIDKFQVSVTPTEFLAMYFFSGLMLHSIDRKKFYDDLMGWSVLGAVNTRNLGLILSYLPLDVYQCFWQQQSTQAFLYPPIKENPVVSATRILRYWRFPRSVPIQQLALDDLRTRVSPKSDEQSASVDAAMGIQTQEALGKQKRYGRFHQSAAVASVAYGSQENQDKNKLFI